MQINVTYWLALKIDLLDGVVTGKIVAAIDLQVPVYQRPGKDPLRSLALELLH